MGHAVDFGAHLATGEKQDGLTALGENVVMGLDELYMCHSEHFLSLYYIYYTTSERKSQYFFDEKLHKSRPQTLCIMTIDISLKVWYNIYNERGKRLTL